MERISIASLGKPFGVKGEVNAYLMTDFPELRFKKGEHYFLVTEQGRVLKEVTLASFRNIAGGMLLRFEEIKTPEEMAPYRNCLLEMDKAKAPVPEGAIRYADIIGFAMVNEDGKPLGTLISVMTYTPTPNLKGKTEKGKTFYVPFNDFFVKQVNQDSKTIVIHEIGGLV